VASTEETTGASWRIDAMQFVTTGKKDGGRDRYQEQRRLAMGQVRRSEELVESQELGLLYKDAPPSPATEIILAIILTLLTIGFAHRRTHHVTLQGVCQHS